MRRIVRTFAFILLLSVNAFAQSVEGRIRFDGKPPAAPDHKITRDHDVCGQHKPNEILLISNGGLANVVVSVEGAPAVRSQPLSVGEVIVANENCRFAPHVSAATVGSTLIVQNRDSILHNTHVYLSDESTYFNIAFPKKGMQIKRPLPKPDVLSFKCDVGHTWMSAYVHVFAHPFFAVSDALGNFKIDGLPPGQYTLKAWHEKLGTKVQRIEVGYGTTKTEFTYK